jgi:hypothetical protein
MEVLALEDLTQIISYFDVLLGHLHHLPPLVCLAFKVLVDDLRILIHFVLLRLKFRSCVLSHYGVDPRLVVVPVDNLISLLEDSNVGPWLNNYLRLLFVRHQAFVLCSASVALYY